MWGYEFGVPDADPDRGGPALDVQGVSRSVMKIVTEETDENDLELLKDYLTGRMRTTIASE